MEGRPGLSDSYHEGLSAYAHRQAAIRMSMRETCTHAWRFVEQWVKLGMTLTDSGEEVDENKLDDTSGHLIAAPSA